MRGLACKLPIRYASGCTFDLRRVEEQVISAILVAACCGRPTGALLDRDDARQDRGEPTATAQTV